MSVPESSKNENPQGGRTPVEETDDYKDVFKKRLKEYGIEESRTLEIYLNEKRCTFRVKSEDISLPGYEDKEILLEALSNMTELKLLENFPGVEESYEGLRQKEKHVQVEIQTVREIKDNDFDKLNFEEISFEVGFIRDDGVPTYVKQVKELLKNLRKSRISELEIRMDPNYVPSQTNNL